MQKLQARLQKLQAEPAKVVEERNLAVAECHRLRCELEAKLAVPVAEVLDDPNLCDEQDCPRPAVRQVDIFGEPGGPGASAFVCEQHAQDHERHKAELEKARERIELRKRAPHPRKKK